MSMFPEKYRYTIEVPEWSGDVLFFLLTELGLAGGLGAGLGALVGFLAGMLEEASGKGPLVTIGLLTGLAAGLFAVVAGREVLPKLGIFSLPVRIVLVILTLTGAAFAVTTLGFLVFPKFSLRATRAVLLVGSINGMMALLAGTLVFLYEDMARRLTNARDMLAAERLAQVQARERAARAELKALQARINPHFFFNALNTAAAFVQEDPPRAEQLLERFSDLFRYAFRRGGEAFVPLAEELAFIRDYLEIEKARFGDKVRCTVSVDPEIKNQPVPPLILQPLVENALAHGRDPESGQGLIAVRAFRARGGSVVLEVRDHGPGLKPAFRQLPKGHALENIAARVAASAGGRLEIGPAEDGPGTQARIVIPPGPRR